MDDGTKEAHAGNFAAADMDGDGRVDFAEFLGLFGAASNPSEIRVPLAAF